MKSDKIKITVENSTGNDDEMSITFPIDTTLEGWVGIFKTILTHATFTESQIREVFSEDYYEN